MKKFLLTSLALFSMLVISAQNTVPNGDFENWSVYSYGIPLNYVASSDAEGFASGLPANEVRVSDPFHGNFAIKLTTVANAQDTVFGYFVNISPNGDPTTWHGGAPYNQMPTGLHGHYKSKIAAGDSAVVFVAFSAGGSNIRTYFKKISGVDTVNYHTFDLVFNPPLSTTPDSAIFGAASSDVLTNVAFSGSSITLDSISFVGASQPTWLNGDFEQWTTNSISYPTAWYINSNGNMQGLQRTNDSKTGSFAVELTTFYGDNNGMPAAQSGDVSTGHFPRHCSNNCIELGGSPFTNQVDTLAFWYKYTPANGDSGQVMLIFKNNGAPIGFTGDYMLAASTYTYKEVPFSLFQVPDSVIIEFRSSINNDTAISFVGSDLKIDNAIFKSQLHVGLHEQVMTNDMMLYPNPAKDKINLQLNPQLLLAGAELHIYNFIGQSARVVSITGHTVTIERNNMPAGMYFYQLINNNEVLKSGKIALE